MGRKEFIVRRVVQIAIIYFAVATALFLLFRFSPGNPLAQFIGPGFSPEQAELLRERFGLDEPLYVQYLKWLQSAATFSFGISFSRSEPVWDVIAGQILNTLVLMLTAIVIAYLIAVPFGAYLAWNRGSAEETVGVLVGLVSRSAPVFWTGLLALWFFGFHLEWLPAGGMTEAGATFDSRLALYTSPQFLERLVLPATVQAFYYFSLPMLLMRNSMIEVMNQDYVEFADLKGLTENRVMLRHAARTAMLPVVTAFALGAARAIGASIVIETVFAWPGIGRQIVRSLVRSDYPVAQGIYLVMTVMILGANLLADLAYGYLDPRVTYD
jgi:peptide/nickel transport system permease protein